MRDFRILSPNPIFLHIILARLFFFFFFLHGFRKVSLFPDRGEIPAQKYTPVPPWFPRINLVLANVYFFFFFSFFPFLLLLLPLFFFFKFKKKENGPSR